MAKCKMCNTEVTACKPKLLAHIADCPHYKRMGGNHAESHVTILREHKASYASYFNGVKGKLEPEGEFEYVDFSVNGDLKRHIITRVCDPNFVNVTKTTTIQTLKNWLYQDGILNTFNAGFWDRVPMNANVIDAKVYYRVMSDGERGAVNSDDPFKAAFDFRHGDTYLYWMSSSLAKIRAFGNENATDDARNVGEYTFSTSPIETIAVAPSQDKTTARPEALHMHQEGFGELGMFDKPEYVTDVKQRNLDHNIGFTRTLHSRMKGLLVGFKFLP